MATTGYLKLTDHASEDGVLIGPFDNIKVEMVPDADVVCKYDYRGRMVKGKYNSTNLRFTYDGDQIIAEYDGEGNLLRKFVYGPGIDEPVCMIDVMDNNAVYYYFFDGLGSVVALSKENTEIVEKYEDTVFGEPNHASDANNPYLLALSMSLLVVVPSSLSITNPLRLLSVASGTASQSEKKFLHD